MTSIRRKLISIILFSLGIMFLLSCVSGAGAVSAEEYYSLGMAYMDMGRYEEAARKLGCVRCVQDKGQQNVG